MQITSKEWVALGVLALQMGISPVYASEPSDLCKENASQGASYGQMNALLEKTILSIDVLSVQICFNKTTTDQLRTLIHEKRYSGEIENEIARLVPKASEAEVTVRFYRDITLEQYLEGAENDLKRARDAQLISEEVFEEVKSKLPTWFSEVKERGFRDQDRIHYLITPHSLKTQIFPADGTQLLDKTMEGGMWGQAVLGAYMAPGSNLRKLLVRSLFSSD